MPRSRGGGCLKLLEKLFARTKKIYKKCYTNHTLYSCKNSTAFTLAEVLITLGIIGVVAAITIPVLITKYNEKVWLAAFKRSYSSLNQAYLSVFQDNGIAKNWCDKKNTECSQIYIDLLAPHLNIVEIWGSDIPQVLKKIKYKDLDGTLLSQFKEYYWFSLNEGSFVGISYNLELEMPLLLVDTNGKKGPNQLGKDFFFLSLNNRNDSPVIAGYSKWWLYDAVYCTTGESAGAWYRGGGCSLWVISTGNMDYLSRDIPIDEWQRNVKKLLMSSDSSSLN